MTGAQIALWLALAVAVAYTVLAYPNKYGALTGRSRLYRTVGLCIIDLLLMLVLMGTYIDFFHEVTRRVGLIRQVFYWSSCLVLGLSLPLVAALDALESYSAVRREKRAFLDKMIQDEVERVKAAAEEKQRKQRDDSARP